MEQKYSHYQRLCISPHIRQFNSEQRGNEKNDPLILENTLKIAPGGYFENEILSKNKKVSEILKNTDASFNTSFNTFL